MYPRHGASGPPSTACIERQHDLHLESGSAVAQEKPAVLQPSYVCEDSVDPDRLAKPSANTQGLDLVEGESEAALALRWEGSPSYERISGFALGIRRGRRQPTRSACLSTSWSDGTSAQTLGAILRDEMGVDSEILVIDGVVLWDFDYIDLGRIRMPSQTVPSPQIPGIPARTRANPRATDGRIAAITKFRQAERERGGDTARGR